MADTSKINEILNYYGLKTNIEETKKWVKQYVGDALTGITTDLMTNVTYNELVSLRDNNNLKPGMKYRMVDYVTKVYDEDGEITSAEHPFDLILTAINENTLDENARVALHDGDEYFKDCNVEAWEVKYCLDNDTDRFSWTQGEATESLKVWIENYSEYLEGAATYTYDENASVDDFYYADSFKQKYPGYVHVFFSVDASYYTTVVSRTKHIKEGDVVIYCENNGDSNNTGTAKDITYKEGTADKGVIYYMKDEWGNEAPYDFKNILQKDGEYTFGDFSEDYSLQGNINCVYGNKIMLAMDCETNQQIINKVRIVNENSHSNLIKPSVQNSYINLDIEECDISMNDDGELVVFKTADFISGIENHTIEHDYRKDYLTFEAVNDDTEIIFKTYTDDSQYTKTIEVSKDKVNWESKTSSSEGVILATLNAGECLYLRGNNSSYGYHYDDLGYYLPNFILPLNDCYVYGNVMSLIDSNNFRTLTEITDDYALYSLFNDYWNGDYSGEYVLSHQDKKLELPATTLATECYYRMFRGCSSLTAAPELPATTLASNCYTSMFSGCTSLTTAPELPATTLAYGCYQNMFSRCTSLTEAPELPATTLAESCYGGMFQGCTSLTTAPELPATTLAEYCYYYMFYRCSNLNYIKCLATNISANNCTTYWVYGVQTNTGMFIKHPDATSWTTGDNGIPTNWAVEDAVIEEEEDIDLGGLF